MATNEDVIKMDDIVPEFPIDALTPYRKQASFDWKKIKFLMDSEEVIRYRHRIWTSLEKNELFHKSPVTMTSLDQIRHVTQKRIKLIMSSETVNYAEMLNNPILFLAWLESYVNYDQSLALKLFINYFLYPSVIASLGTEKHANILQKSTSGEIQGCLALTEIAHGSNTKGIMTTATFDINTKEFVLNSDGFRSAKCWSGGMGQTATYVVVYAQLITANGVRVGLHAFIVPIRCMKSLRPFPGVIVGDMGEKIGINGIDNGFLMFNNYRVSRDCLLNKIGDVDDNGNYITAIKNSKKRFGASLGTLSAGRIGVTALAISYLQKAVFIAIRYSAVRKQFGPEDSDEELSIIEYQQHQLALIPYLAGVFAGRIFTYWFAEIYGAFLIDSITGADKEGIGAKSIELHALSSASKPTLSWMARDGIQVCREACGGHGYLRAAGIGTIRDGNDANVTYEGDNKVLIQQTSKWLLSLYKSLEKGEKIHTVYDIANYLNEYKTILKSKANISNVQQAIELKSILDAHKWLVCYILKITSEKAEKLLKEGNDKFTINNNIQSYYAGSLSIIFCEYAILDKFCNFASNVNDENCRDVLMKMVLLYGAWTLEKHMAALYMGGYFNGTMGQMLREGILELCLKLKPEVVALVDSLAPPDFVMDSVLGKSDGKVYERLQESFFTYPGALSRPDWWEDIVHWQGNVNSKL